MKERAIIALLLCLCFVLFEFPQARAATEVLSLTLPDLDWTVKIKASGFALEQKHTNPGGESGYFMASRKKAGLIISGHIEKVGRSGTPKEAREHFSQKLVGPPVKRGEMTLSEFGNLATTEYMVREFRGKLINQKNLYAFLTRDHYWMYIHFSKTNFHQADEPFLKALLENISIEAKDPAGKIGTAYRLSKAPHLLTFDVPEAWTDEIKRAKEDLPPTLTFKPGGVPASEIHMTPMLSTQQDPGFNSPEKIRSIVEDAGKKFLPQTLEKKLVIREMKGKSLHGLYYTLTDKKPDLPASEFKVMTQGAFAVGELLVTFTIFTQTQDSPVVKTALEMIAGASHSR